MEPVTPAAAPGVDPNPGQGVKVSEIVRIKSEFYDNQLMKARTMMSYWQRQRETLEGIEVIFMEPGEHSINQYLSEFFNAWQDLSINPESEATRIALREQAVTLTNVVRDIYSRLFDLSNDLAAELEVSINEVNNLAREIASLNEDIVYLQSLGKKSNELLDERDKRLHELAELIDIRVVQKANGALEVIAGQRTLLHDDRYFELKMEYTEEGKVYLVNDRGMQLYPSGGKLESIIYSYNETFPCYMGHLDRMVEELVSRVNELHLQGYDLYGNQAGCFFAPLLQAAPGEKALPPSLRFRVAEEIIEDVNRIAASAKPQSPGDGSLALSIAGLSNERCIAQGTTTFSDYFRGFISQLGVEGRESERAVVAMRATMDQLEMVRESISGVSLDDEMLDMIQFQHAYNAASKFLSILDEMLFTLINELG